MLLSELAEALGAQARGNGGREVEGIASAENPKANHISFVGKEELLAGVEKAGGIALVEAGKVAAGGDHIAAENGRLAFAESLAIFDPRPVPAPGVHPTAVVHPLAKVAESASVGAFVVVEEGAVVGEGVILYPFVYVGAEAVIGDYSVLNPHVTIYALCNIGKRCILHANTVIGSDGFGFIDGEDGHIKMPQIGTVAVGDDVEFGAICAVDRATIDVTTIENGVKTDNMVHVGHNTRVGEHSRLTAQVGISGSVDIGRHTIFAGQAGAADHVTIGDYAIIYGRGGVTKDIPAGRQIYSGMPAQLHQDSVAQHRTLKALTQQAPMLMQLFDRIAKLEKALADKEK